MAIAIEQSDNTLRVNKDCYDLGRIVGVQVKALGWMDRLKKTLLLGVVTSSVLFTSPLPTSRRATGSSCSSCPWWVFCLAP